MKKLAFGILISVAAVSAHSQNSAELLLGSAQQETDLNGYATTSGSDISAGVRGSFSFNPNFAVELAYQGYGETDDTFVDSYGDTVNFQFRSSAINVGVKGSVPLQNGISLNARAGMSLWDVGFTATDSSKPGAVAALDDDGSDLYYGIGVQFNVSETFIVGAEYTITDIGMKPAEFSFDHTIKNLALSAGFVF